MNMNHLWHVDHLPMTEPSMWKANKDEEKVSVANVKVEADIPDTRAADLQKA